MLIKVRTSERPDEPAPPRIWRDLLPKEEFYHPPRALRRSSRGHRAPPPHQSDADTVTTSFDFVSKLDGKGEASSLENVEHLEAF